MIINFKKVYQSLLPSATGLELELLSQCFPGNELPHNIVALYQWHNGQTGSFSLNQRDNRTFLPVEEVVSSWQFLNDPMEDISEPLSRSWIPILYNGAGDYLMYESQGINKSRLISYWHDSERRDLVHENLEAWAQEVLRAASI